MVIQNIYIKNFLCFSGENTIKFNRGLNLILGGNGYGKTKLYDAFNWVLKDCITNQNGSVEYTSSTKERLISRKAIKQKKDKGKIECLVSIDVSKDHIDYRIIRSYSIQKMEDGTERADANSKVEILEKTTTEFKPITIERETDFKIFIDKEIISLEKISHIWFQGERGIAKAIDTSNEESFQQIIKNLSYVAHWDEYNKTANAASKSIENIYKKALKSLEKKQKEKEDIEQSLDENQKRLTEKGEEKENLEEEIHHISTKLEMVNDMMKSYPKFLEIKTEKEKIENLLETKSSELDKQFDKADRKLFNDYWLIHGSDYLVSSYQRLLKEYEYTEMDEIKAVNSNPNHPDIPLGSPEPIHIKKMLEQEHCYICDRPAPKDSDHYKKIERLLPKNYPKTEAVKESYYHKNTFKNLVKNAIQIEKDKDSFENNSQEIISSFYSLQQEIIDLKSEYESIKKDEFNVLRESGLASLGDVSLEMDKNNRWTSDLSRNNRKLGGINKELEDLKNTYLKLMNRRNTLVEGDVNPMVKKYKDFFLDFIKAVEHGKTNDYSNLIMLLEKQANKHYHRINEASGAYEGSINFSPTRNGGFISKIVDSNGDDVTSNMNTAQILSMQLSILMAILSTNKNKQLTKQYPLIADAPNSAFDYKKRQALFKEIAGTFDQSIMMMFEYLEDDPSRTNRFRVNKKGINELKKEIAKSDTEVNVIQLDIPDGIDIKDLSQLSINISNV